MQLSPAITTYRGATPYLIVSKAADAISFYKTAFGAIELVRLAEPSGKIAHAELKIGEVVIMLADEYAEMGYKSPTTLGGSAVSILVYVDNVDEIFSRALKAGAQEVMTPSDQFDGDRRGTLKDPFGHTWLLATKKEQISYEEMLSRFQSMMQSGENDAAT
jgi:PhnB protein